MTLELAENPARRGRRRRAGRDSMGRFLRGHHNPSENPTDNPRRRKRRTRRYRNPAMASSANPRRKRRSYRRNPESINSITDKLWGVGLEEGLAGVATLVGVEAVGQAIDKMLPKWTAPSGGYPSGQNPIKNAAGEIVGPPVEVVDVGYAIRKALPNGIAAAGGYLLSGVLKLPRDIRNAIGVVGLAETVAKAIGASHIAPNVLMDGSLIVAHPILTGGGVVRQLPAGGTQVVVVPPGQPTPMGAGSGRSSPL